MAKGIDINGQLRGKRGGVVYYRTNGQQISRARNFAPKNPKTDKQLIQRAVTASVIKMYQAGKAILDHSFEGKSVPAGSMREFQRVNMNALRANILAQYEYLKNHPNITTDDELVAGMGIVSRCVSPHADTCAPSDFIISKGTYKNSAIYLDGAKIAFPGVADNPTDTAAEYLQRWNIAAGDIATLCVLVSNYYDYSRVSSADSRFLFVRLICKGGNDQAIVGQKVGDLFEIEGSAGVDASWITALANLAFTDAGAGPQKALDIIYVDPDHYLCSAAGIICSRDDLGLRSNTTMQVFDRANEQPWSVTALSLVESWRNASGDVQSDLILEGGNF